MTQDSPFQAILLEQRDGRTVADFRHLTRDDLPEGDVRVAVRYSSLNYKDALAVTGKGKIARAFPMVPGIDLVGTVEASESPLYRAGDPVICTGWGIGELHWGGFSQVQRLRSEWLVPLPKGLEPLQSMAIGTAGFAAMLCVLALEDGGVTPDRGPVLVTGASGGVGSVATAVLAKLGYRVTALPGRSADEEYLRELGAADFVCREEMERSFRPLENQRWAGAVDTVGTRILARVLAEMRYYGTVASCGLAGGSDLPATVMPFILRGVRLQGVESVQCPQPRRREAWERLKRDLPAAALERIGSTAISLAEVPSKSEELLGGEVRGRVIVDVNR